jgi:hypothetical protein
MAAAALGPIALPAGVVHAASLYRRSVTLAPYKLCRNSAKQLTRRATANVPLMASNGVVALVER